MSGEASERLSLAICSATATASVALLRGREVIEERSAADGRHQAESLLPLVDEILHANGVELPELHGFCLAIGPGSFTSLRIGLATVKGLAFGGDQPVAAISTLYAMAASVEASEETRILVPMLDARRDEVYAAAHAGAGSDWEPRADILPERVYDAGELAACLPPEALLLGEGAAIVGEALRDALGSGIEIAPGDAGELPSAAAVGRLGAEMLARGDGVPAASLAPRYVRRAEAEVQRTQERFEAPPS